MHRVFPLHLTPLLCCSLFLQSCNTLISSNYRAAQAPEISSKTPKLLVSPDEHPKNQVSMLISTAPNSQAAELDLALKAHTFTAHSGQRVNFLQNAQGIWQASIYDPWTGENSSTLIPVFCQQQSNLVSILQKLYQQAPSIQKYQIHVLPTRQSNCVFLGNLGLQGGMQGQKMLGSSTLLEAVDQQNIELVNKILATGVDPNIPDEHGFTPLHSAVLNNNLALVKLLVENGAKLNIVDKNGFMPLSYAAEQGDLAVGKLLLLNQANPDGIAGNRADFTYSPLQLAIENGHLEMVKLLLDSNANVYLPDYYGNLPLQLAIEHPQNNIALVSLLLEYGVDPNIGDHFNLTPLHVAANGGHLDIVKLLLANGADPNRVEEDGYTPLHFAAMQGYPAIAALLIDHYAEQGVAFSKSLHWAVAKGLISLVEELLAAKLAPNNTDYLGGFTPLLIAATFNRCEIGKILLDNGADPNQATVAGLNPLQVAITNNHIEFVKLLLSAGVSLNVVDQYENNPLNMATKYGNKEIVSLLLAYDPKTNSLSTAANKVLYTAAYYGHLDLVKFWLDQGVSLDLHTPETKLSPLGAAVYKGHLNIVKFLLAKGASLHSCAQNGYTLLHLAASANHIEVIAFLLRSGADINAQANDGNTFLHILVNTQPALFLQSLQAVEAHTKLMLSQLQDNLLAVFPTLASNSNEAILAIVVDYAEGIKWDLKNIEEKTIIDILKEEASLAKDSKQFDHIFKVVNRHQRLGGWYQASANKKVRTKKASFLPAQAVKKKKTG